MPNSEGVPRFQERTFRLHENGGLDDFELAAGHEFSGRRIAIGSRVFLDQNGRLRAVFLYENTVIQGVEYQASLLRPGYFDADGMLLGDNME